jgi:hypothetical protein
MEALSRQWYPIVKAADMRGCKAQGEKHEPAHPGRAHAEDDKDRRAMIEDLYQEVVNKRKPIRAVSRCVWCGEEVGKPTSLTGSTCIIRKSTRIVIAYH